MSGAPTAGPSTGAGASPQTGPQTGSGSGPETDAEAGAGRTDLSPADAVTAPLGLRRTPVALAVFTAAALVLLVVLARAGRTVLSFTSGTDALSLPSASLPVRATGVVVVVLAALATAASAWWATRGRPTPLWCSLLFALVLLVGFLVWATAGHTLPVVGLLAGALALSVPLVFGALGGVVCERVGVVNVAIEGQLLAGAFVSAVVASATGSLVAGLAAAVVAGVLVSLVLAVFAITYLVDQVIVGVVLNVLVLGLTNFLYSTVLSTDAAHLNRQEQLPTLGVPGLDRVPVLGPVLFRQTLIVYLAYVAVPVVTYALFRTRWGLRLRAVGEHPQAADTVGIDVARTRFWGVSIAGAVAGLGGAFYTLGSVGAFSKDITSGAGYIALAAVISGRWNPLRATAAALLFGFASNLQNVLSIVGSPVPSDVLLMLPYLVTVVAVAGLVGQVRGPAAAGRPYVKS